MSSGPSGTSNPSGASPPGRGRFQVLALDGGGVKALFTAHVLARLEADLGVHIAESFDLIAGTSAGGVIALGLGAGMRPAEIVEHYTDLTMRVFPRSRRARWRYVPRAWSPAYSGDGLARGAQRGLGSRLLGESTKRLVIPSWDVQRGEVHVFKTPHHERLRRDWQISMVDVAMATTAAPTFFPAAAVDGQRLIDGGVWANNPSVVAIGEAVSMLGVRSMPSGCSTSALSTNGRTTPSDSTRAAGRHGPRPRAIHDHASSRGAQGTAMHLVGKDELRPLRCHCARATSSPWTVPARTPSPGWPLARAGSSAPSTPQRFADHVAQPLHPDSLAGPKSGNPTPPGGDIMKHTDYFKNFLENTVNLSKFNLDLLSQRVDTIYGVLKADEDLGPLIKKKIPQGSWPQKTIIRPQNGKAFDGDFMVQMVENPEWEDDKKKYGDAHLQRASQQSPYKDMPHGRKCRCVYVNYANNAMHVDIVPFVIRADGNQWIINRDKNEWERTDTDGFTNWMKEKDAIAGKHLREVIRIMKFLRDHKNSFTGTKSILLTTLLGERVEEWRKIVDPGYYGDLPTALLHIVSDLDEWLLVRPSR